MLQLLHRLALLLVQTDVTEQVEREQLLSQLVEGQLALLSQVGHFLSPACTPYAE